MTVNYTTLLGLAKPVSGTESGTWGDTVNTNLTDYLDSAVAGAQSISGSLTAVTLSKTTGASLSQAGTGATGSSQYQIIRCTGNPASLLTITVPAADKTYIIINATSTSQSVKIVGAGPTTGVTILSGKTSLVTWNGSDFVEITPATATTATTATNLASGSAGTIPYQSASGTTAMLAAGTAGQVLTSQGSSAPTWSTPAAATKTISNKTGAYTVVAGDLGSIINCTSGTFTVSLTAAASLGSGFTCTIWNTSNAYDAITIDPAGTETIDSVATLILRRGEGLAIVCDGINWQTDDKKPMRAYAENIFEGYSRPVASGNSAIAIGSNGATSSGDKGLSINGSASSNYSSAIGLTSGGSGSVTATGAGAMALGGSYASGTDSFAAAIANNTSSYGATGNNSVAIGKLAKATTLTSLAIGSAAIASGLSGTAIGNQANATGQESASIGYYASATATWAFAAGYGAIASGYGSIAIGGSTASTTYAVAIGGGTASNLYSVAIGINAKAAQKGKYAFSGTAYGTLGDAQAGKLILIASTTTTTAVALTSDGGGTSTNNQLIVASDQAMAIQGTLIAKVSGTGAMAGWNITGIVSNNGGTMAVSGLALTAIGTDSITLGAQPTIAVDNTNKGVTITSGYKAATSIRWVATLNTSEVTYA